MGSRQAIEIVSADFDHDEWSRSVQLNLLDNLWFSGCL